MGGAGKGPGIGCPLWRPREQVQPSLTRWVKETSHGNVPYYNNLVPLLKKQSGRRWGTNRRTHAPANALWDPWHHGLDIHDGSTVVESVCWSDESPAKGAGEEALFA